MPVPFRFVSRQLDKVSDNFFSVFIYDENIRYEISLAFRKYMLIYFISQLRKPGVVALLTSNLHTIV